MKYSFSFLILILTLGFLPACQVDDDPVEEVPNTEPLISLSEDALFSNIEDGVISITIEDDLENTEASSIAAASYEIKSFDGTEISKGRIPGNDNLISYEIVISADEYDTNDVEEPYTLSVSATDSKGLSSSQSKEFSIYQGYASIGLAGDAIPGGWHNDADMTEIKDGVYELLVDLTANNVKFRADDDWAINWGASTFPTGIGIQGGPNIPIREAGKYLITFDVKDGSYNFEKQ